MKHHLCENMLPPKPTWHWKLTIFVGDKSWNGWFSFSQNVRYVGLQFVCGKVSQNLFYIRLGSFVETQLTITWSTDISLQFSNSKPSSINDYVLVIELEHHLQLALIINNLLTMLVENHGDNTAKKSNCAFWGHYEVRLSCPNWLLGF